METRDTTSKSAPGLESSGPASGGSRDSFRKYLIAAREGRGMSLDEIADVTRIPARSLERLEAAEFEQLPADVFVRGFLRSYARCVGLDVDEAIRRYAECGMTPAPVATPMAEELASSLATLESSAAPTLRRVSRTGVNPVVNPGANHQARPADAGAQSEASTERRARADTADGSHAAAGRSRSGKRKGKRRKKRKATSGATRAQTARSCESSPVSADAVAPRAITSAGASGSNLAPAPDETQPENEPTSGGPPLAAPAATPARPRTDGDVGSGRARTAEVAMPQPSLVIDDAFPEDAARVQEARIAEQEESDDASWRQFLPDALLDPESGSRRGTLTLAVIILVIVATLAMSYLLKKPGDSDDGVTRLDPGAHITEPAQVAAMPRSAGSRGA